MDKPNSRFAPVPPPPPCPACCEFLNRIPPGNRLELLPRSLSELTQLEVLTLSSNHVYRLPDEIIGLEKLRVRATWSIAWLADGAFDFAIHGIIYGRKIRLVTGRCKRFQKTGAVRTLGLLRKRPSLNSISSWVVHANGTMQLITRFTHRTRFGCPSNSRVPLPLIRSCLFMRQN